MFKKIIFLCSLLMTLGVNAQSLRFSADDADFYFTSKFLKTAFENSKDNFVVSPLSVYVATTLLANGADGNSKNELNGILSDGDSYQRPRPRRGLSSDLNAETFNIDAINKKLASYMTQKKDKIKITNTLSGKNFRPDYIAKMEKELFATVNDKKAEPHKLKIINEVEFKDNWIHPFEKFNTHVKEFHSLDGKIDEVDMMHDYERTIDYYQDEEMQAVRLPYEGGNVMHIFLPKEGTDFNEFIQKLHAGKLYLDYKPLPTEIFIPKFVFNHEVSDMISFYKNWGIQDVFSTEKANLGKLSDVPHFVEKITHKAKIKTDEIGTEAYAITGMVLAEKGIHREPLKPRKWKIIFNANRPFIFMINNGDFIGVYIKGKRFKEEKKTSN